MYHILSVRFCRLYIKKHFGVFFGSQCMCGVTRCRNTTKHAMMWYTATPYTTVPWAVQSNATSLVCVARTQQQIETEHDANVKSMTWRCLISVIKHSCYTAVVRSTAANAIPTRQSDIICLFARTKLAKSCNNDKTRSSAIAEKPRDAPYYLWM